MTGDIIGEYSFDEPLKTGRSRDFYRHDAIFVRQE